MRRIALTVLCFLMLMLLVPGVLAATSASSMAYSATVSADGSCQVTVDMTLHLETASQELTFPLPVQARNVTLNGSSARTQRSGNVQLVSFSRLLGGAIGDFSIRLQYQLPDVVAYNESKRLELSLPILSGFSYPVDSLTFSVSLPGAPGESTPAFSSGYYQQNIESELEWSALGSLISGSARTQLKDRETLVMTLSVTEALFPQDPTAQWSIGVEDVGMIALAVLALLYWLLFLRCLPPRRIRTATAPEGFHPGNLGSALIGQGTQLSLMVLGWAQQGYILIHLQDNGSITLHKRMDMGNERSALEVRIFRSLFGKRSMIDGTGYHYAALCRKVSSMPPDVRDLFRRSSGNPRVFRILAAGIGVLGGLSLGSALAGDALLSGLVAVITAIAGGIVSWLIQDWAKGLHLHDRSALWLGLACGAIWLILGIVAQEFNVAACVVAGQLLAGLAAAYGGRRTSLGKHTAAEILGLRRYLRTVPPQELQRITRSHPDYFFALAPYALALGVDRTFAKQFGNRKLSACPYLTTGMDGHLTAPEWSQLLRQAVSLLDARQKKLPLERLFGR